jgi:hypothetical protein
MRFSFVTPLGVITNEFQGRQKLSRSHAGTQNMCLDDELQTQPSLKAGCVRQLIPDVEGCEQGFGKKELK